MVGAVKVQGIAASGQNTVAPQQNEQRSLVFQLVSNVVKRRVDSVFMALGGLGGAVRELFSCLRVKPLISEEKFGDLEKDFEGVRDKGGEMLPTERKQRYQEIIKELGKFSVNADPDLARRFEGLKGLCSTGVVLCRAEVRIDRIADRLGNRGLSETDRLNLEDQARRMNDVLMRVKLEDFHSSVQARLNNLNIMRSVD